MNEHTDDVQVDTEGTSSDSSTETANADQTQSQEGDQTHADNKDGGDFSKHPRWVERETDWKTRFNEQEKRHIEEIGKLRQEFGGKTQTQDKPQETNIPPVPSWFGGDENSWKEYYGWTQGLVKTAEENAIKRFQSQTESQKKAIEEATNYMNAEVATIESDKTLNPEGQKIDVNKLLKTALDNDLVDSKGRWNYRAAFKLMKPQDVFKAKDALNERKRIADATTTSNRADSNKKFVTHKDLEQAGDAPWNNDN